MSECLNHEMKSELEVEKIGINNKNYDVYNRYFTISDEIVKKYYLFATDKIKFKPVENLHIRECILKSVANLRNFYNEIDCNLLSNDETMQLIKDFIYNLRRQKMEPIVFVEFEDLILKLAKEKETKEIILKYFDIKE